MRSFALEGVAVSISDTASHGGEITWHAGSFELAAKVPSGQAAHSWSVVIVPATPTYIDGGHGVAASHRTPSVFRNETPGSQA